MSRCCAVSSGHSSYDISTSKVPLNNVDVYSTSDEQSTDRSKSNKRSTAHSFSHPLLAVNKKSLHCHYLFRFLSQTTQKVEKTEREKQRVCVCVSKRERESVLDWRPEASPPPQTTALPGVSPDNLPLFQVLLHSGDTSKFLFSPPQWPFPFLFLYFSLLRFTSIAPCSPLRFTNSSR